MADIFIGNVKGPQGDTGATGATGPQGDAATIAVGSTTTVPYGQAARVTNSGTSGAAVFDFVIPQGRPGEQVNKIDNLTIDAITEPSTAFPVPAVGDNGSTLFGKISKWFSDMSALVATKLNVANVVNNLTTTSSGYALDARQGKALNDAVSNAVAKIAVPNDRRISASSLGLSYQTLSNNSWIDSWNFYPVYSQFVLSRTGIAVTLSRDGIYMILEGTQRNNAGFTNAMDVFIVTRAGGSITYNKIYSGQSAAYTITTTADTISFINYQATTNLGVVVYSIL